MSSLLLALLVGCAPAGAGGLGLDADNLAQFEPELNAVFLNWDPLAQDQGFLRRALGRRGAVQAQARLLLPEAGHELTHAGLRRDFGEDFPGTVEEELVAHAEQASLYHQILAEQPLFAGLDAFAAHHNNLLHSAWLKGFKPLFSFVARKNAAFPSLSDPPEEVLVWARRDRALLAGRKGTPRVWFDRIDRAIALWSDPARLERLATFLGENIYAAAARMERLRRRR